MTWRRWLAAIGLVFVLIQLWPVDRANPPIEAEVPAPPGVLAVLERSCFACHSNRTDWPWYAYLAPVSWLITNDVAEGRERLNFSTWNRYDLQRKRKRLADILDEVVRGEMPLPIYLRMHPEAVLSGMEIQQLRRWIVSYRPVEELPETGAPAELSDAPGGAGVH